MVDFRNKKACKNKMNFLIFAQNIDKNRTDVWFDDCEILCKLVITIR